METRKQKPAPPDGNYNFPEEEVQEAIIGQESAKEEDPISSVFNYSGPIREDRIEKAIEFLSDPRVRGTSGIRRILFLQERGLTFEEINEAFRRFPDPVLGSQTTYNGRDVQPQAWITTFPSWFRWYHAALALVSGAGTAFFVKDSVRGSQNTYNSQSIISNGQQVVSYIQPQARIPTFLSWFRWYHAVLALASGAGTAIFVKRSLIPRIESWVRRTMLEVKTDLLEKAEDKHIAEVVAATVAANDLVKISIKMMSQRNQEMIFFGRLMHLLAVQVPEISSLRNSIRKLEWELNRNRKVYTGEQHSGTDLQVEEVLTIKPKV